MPDPESYSNPGYIDVLYVGDQLPQGTPTRCTPGYSQDQYDDERWMSVVDAGIIGLKNEDEKEQPQDSRRDCCTSTVSRKRKRPSEEDLISKKSHASTRHESTWSAFQYYLDRCNPVKIHNVSRFRSRDHAADEQAVEEMSEALLTGRHLESLPSEILDKIVTVQCAFYLTEPTGGTTTDCKSPQELDRAISFCSKDAGIIPTFMGQEDQITSEMTLREVLSWNKGVMQSTNQSEEQRAPRMSVCIAQGAILTRGGAPQSSKHEILVELDGRVGRRPIVLQNEKEAFVECDDESSQQPLDYLVKSLRLPSYLLLGNPNAQRDSHLGNDTTTISIHDINLWHAPQHCCSNVHYDDRHNLLMVTEGVKTVELCPPDCIEPSSITSEHANHPLLLRRRNQNTTFSCTQQSSVRDILENKRDATHIISISAGEALYIPPGWWHRVESTQTCTAINVWFDYNGTTTTEDIPKHMIAFRMRQRRRKHYEDYEDDLAASYLKMLRCEPLDGNIISDSHKYLKDFAPLREILLRDTILVTRCVPIFIKKFIECWDKFTTVQSNTLTEMDWVFHLAELMNVFLLRIKLDQPEQVREIVQMWLKFSILRGGGENSLLFANFVKKLKPPSCYVITKAWEKHVSSKCLDVDSSCNQEEAEMSYKHFFCMFDDSTEKAIRLFLIDCAEKFKEDSYMYNK